MDYLVYRFLSLSARAGCDASHLQRLSKETVHLESQLPEWDGVADQAEAQGIAPLLYTHLREAGIQPPPPVRRALQGLYLHHRDANQLKTRVLKELLTTFDAAGVPVLVLKGGALSHLVYPEPGLRPMGDLDLFVAKTYVRQAHDLLVKKGFILPFSSSSPREELLHGHLPAASVSIDGVVVKVEIHHNLFRAYESHSMEMGDLSSLPLPFRLGPDGITARTLGYEDMLRHLCLHFCNIYHSPSLLGTLRLIWVADIISFSEHFARVIDWEKLEVQSPFVVSTLSLLHFLTPLSEDLITQAPIKIERKPEGVGESYRGWPTSALPKHGIKDFGRFLKDTFFPSEWWLRLYYGLDTIQPLFWYRLLHHPLHILGNVKHRNLIGRG
ncbi:MAG: nucleotidyltransferase family protein [Thermodesulfobacteriota bacterium]